MDIKQFDIELVNFIARMEISVCARKSGASCLGYGRRIKIKAKDRFMWVFLVFIFINLKIRI